jgi:hypothetical protein
VEDSFRRSLEITCRKRDQKHIYIFKLERKREYIFWNRISIIYLSFYLSIIYLYFSIGRKKHSCRPLDIVPLAHIMENYKTENIKISPLAIIQHLCLHFRAQKTGSSSLPVLWILPQKLYLCYFSIYIIVTLWWSLLWCTHNSRDDRGWWNLNTQIKGQGLAHIRNETQFEE